MRFHSQYNYNNIIHWDSTNFVIFDRRNKSLRKVLLRREDHSTIYMSIERSAPTQITHYNYCRWNGQGEIVMRYKGRASYNSRGQILSYKDIQGNEWYKKWPIPFVFNHHLDRMFRFEGYIENWILIEKAFPKGH